MRLALAIDSLTGGGAEAIVRSLAQGLAQRGHTVAIYCLKSAGLGEADGACLVAAGVRLREFRSFRRDPLLPVRIGRALRADRIEVTHAHSSAAVLALLPATKLLGVPLIQTRHGALLGRPGRHRRLAERLAPALEAITIVAECLRERLPPGRLARNAVCIPNGVDRPRQPVEAARAALRVLCQDPLEGPVVLAVGTLCPEKDPRGLLRALVQVRRELPDVRLVWIGAARPAAYGELVAADVAARGLGDCVHLIGPVPDAWRLMAGADVFCQPSRTEAMPLALLEAMSQGVPIVATAVGAVGRGESAGGRGQIPRCARDDSAVEAIARDGAAAQGRRANLDTNSSLLCASVPLWFSSGDALLRDPESAWVVPPGEPAALAAALRAALGDRRAALGRAERALGDCRQRFTVDRMLVGYEQIYEVVRTRRGRSGLRIAALGGGRRPAAVRPARRPAVLMLGPAPPQIGGMATSISLLLASPLCRQYELHRLASPIRPEHAGESPRQGGSAPGLRTGIGALTGHVRTLAALLAALRRHRVRMLHIHTCSYFTFYRNLLDLAAAKLLGRAVILHIRGNRFDEFCRTRGPLARGLVRAGLAWADAVIVLSRSWAAALRPDLRRARVFVVPNAFDPAVVRPARERNADAPGRPCRFLYLGAVSDSKGISDLLAAAQRLRTDGVPFELVIAGPAEAAALHEFRKRVQSVNLAGQVRWVGPVAGPAKAELLASADCFVHPSHSEGMPNAILEAAAAGLPVVATSVGAVPEMLTADGAASHGTRALAPLVSPRDPVALAEAMKTLAADPAGRRSLAAGLQAHVTANYSVALAAQRIGAVYESVLRGTRRGAVLSPADAGRGPDRTRSLPLAARIKEPLPPGRGSDPGHGSDCNRSLPLAARTRAAQLRRARMRAGPTGGGLPEWLVRHGTYPLHERLRRRRTLHELRQLERLAELPPAAVEEDCRSRLRDLLQFAAAHLPYYADLFRRWDINPAGDDPFAALARLPVLRKPEIRAHAAAMTWPGGRAGCYPCASGGTSGDTLHFRIDRVRQAQPLAARLFMQARFGVRPGDRRAHLWGAPLELRGSRLQRWRDRLINELLLDAFDLSPARLADHLAALRAFRPRVLYGYASALALLAAYVRELPRRPDLRWLRLVVHTGEEATAAQLAGIRAALPCPIAGEYGSREIGLIAHACPRGRLHVIRPHVHVEILHDGRPADPGQVGEIVCTTLNTRAQPFIRYALGDLGALPAEPCPCGLPWPVLHLAGGKITGFVALPGGRLCHGAVTSHVLRGEAGIREFRTRQPALDRFEVLLVPGPEFDPAALERIRSRYRRLFGPNVKVDCRIVPALPPDPSGKRRYVISDMAASVENFRLVDAPE